MILLLVIAWLAPSAPARPLRPDPTKTPGATMPITRTQMCLTAYYTDTVRHVTAGDRRAVPSGAYEIDHLIPLVMGGSNARENLWPQAYTTRPYNATVKDALENQLRRQVCWGTLALAAAQREIAKAWIASYRRRVRR